MLPRSLRVWAGGGSERCRKCTDQKDPHVERCLWPVHNLNQFKIYFSLICFLSHHTPLLINVKDVYCCLVFWRKAKRGNQIHVRKAPVTGAEHGTQQPERQTKGKSWTAARKSGEVRVVISLVFVRARLLFSWALSSFIGNLEKSNSANVCLKKQE